MRKRPDAARILSQIAPASLREVEQASSLGWVPLEHCIAVSEGLARALTPSELNALLLQNASSAATQPFLSAFIAGAVGGAEEKEGRCQLTGAAEAE